jgi:Calcineurin-like phosphoesterase
VNRRQRLGHGLAVFSLFCGLLLGLSACAPWTPPTTREEMAAVALPRRYVVWMLSDIQPPTKEERRRFEKVVVDVVHLGLPIDMAVIAGDLLKSRSGDEAFNWFLETRAKAPVRRWFEIAGNHDKRSFPQFEHHFQRPPAYGVSFGNVLMLLLSDTEPSSQTEISDASFAWWKSMVIEHRERILLTVSHAQLKGSGLLGSMFPSRVIVDSQRFEEVLRLAPVTLWASGHTHLSHRLPGTFACREELGGSCFVNISAIDAGDFGASESRFLLFSEGSDRLLIRSRDHDRGRFSEDLDIVVTLPQPFVYPEEQPHLFPGP